MTDTNINWHSEPDDPEAFRAFAHHAVHLAAGYLAAIPDQPVFHFSTAEADVDVLVDTVERVGDRLAATQSGAGVVP